MSPADPKQGKRLGRGLDGLLGPAPATSSSPGTTKAAPPAPRDPVSAAIEDVHPNRAQPRTRFDEGKLDELAQSIRELGVLEPILVRKRPQVAGEPAGGFEIIAGERRWRAAQRAGLREVPIVVRELSTQTAFEAAIVENLQREDLNAVETARALQRLIDEHGHTQETIAQKVGKDRTTIANSLRLLKLPQNVLERLENAELSEGHGRALLGAPSAAQMSKLAKLAVEKGWSVRETERQVRAIARASEPAKDGEETAKTSSANVRDLENRLSKSLGARVTLSDRKGEGHIEINYSSYDELDRLLAKLL
ncbi:ParB/RepB/Spo0J family partition protein [Sandaracinus amylolyticus]|uniref:ParB/RepB/Spo0J family partition protein n=1 Tax=Sandaracinus amylolyticus TaxID=927083 RepID=UPI001EFF6DEC|nr:ParB/RepB/Spo0J family partition protein [Sandaracinus amylolyticus]UJR80809.1 ParB domain-containing protein [Sandaracinus amylolyticus]